MRGFRVRGAQTTSQQLSPHGCARPCEPPIPLPPPAASRPPAAPFAPQPLLAAGTLQELAVVFQSAGGEPLSKVSFLVQVGGRPLLHKCSARSSAGSSDGEGNARCLASGSVHAAARKPCVRRRSATPAPATTSPAGQGLAPSLLDLDPDALEAAFRSALLKLQFIDNLLQPLPPGG